MTDPVIAVMMLGVFIVLIMLGFPIAFTLMALGMGFGYYAYFEPERMQTLLDNNVFNLFVNQTYSVMSNDVLTAVPLFLFMGYVVERANIVSRLFSTLALATHRIPGSMAVAALITCALFATATGIVGAVITLMGLLAYPAMLKARYNTSFASGVICAGGTLGILIPPSIMLIVYAATSGVSIVKLYAGALLPGMLLAGLYVVYVIGRSALQPSIAPKPPKEDTEGVNRGDLMRMLAVSFLPLAILILSVLGAILLGLATPSEAASIGALGGLVLAASYQLNGFFAGTDKPPAWSGWQLGEARWGLMPCLAFGAFASMATLVLVTYCGVFFDYAQDITGWPPGLWVGIAAIYAVASRVAGPVVVALLALPGADGPLRKLLVAVAWLAPLVAIVAGGLAIIAARIPAALLSTGLPGDVPSDGIAALLEQVAAIILSALETIVAKDELIASVTRIVALLHEVATYAWFVFGLCAFILVLSVGLLWTAKNLARSGLQQQFLKLTGMGALVGLVTAVLFVWIGTDYLGREPSWRLVDVFVLAFPLLAACMLGTKWNGLRESVYLTVRTSAMVCWLFVGSWTFSSVFSYLGGEQVISEFVTSLDMSPLMFLLLAQFIIFLLGWPLEWSEIVIIFVPIFLPLLPHFGIDPLFFGVLVALNLQTSFLTPPMAMSAYYLKGIAPPHVRLVQIFSGCMPFLMMVFLAMIIVYVLPGIVFWLPDLAYG